MNWLLIAMSPVIYVPPTPQTITAPILHYECDMVDEQFQRHRLRFRDEGGRGYWATEELARATPRHYEFEEDGTGLLGNLRPGARFADRRGIQLEGDNLVVFLEEVTPMAWTAEYWPASLVLTFDRGVAGLQRMVGFCDVRAEPQQPLSQTETQELLRIEAQQRTATH